MFDLVTRRRIIFVFIAVFFVATGLSFIGQVHTIIIDRFVPSYRKNLLPNISIDNDEEANACHRIEPIDVLTLCQKCTSYELRSKAIGCSPTGYKQLVFCSKSNIKISRSCPIPIRTQRQHFWLFEGLMLFVGILAMGSVHSRQNTLSKQMIEKIKRQIEETES